MVKAAHLKSVLEIAYSKYHSTAERNLDPITFPHRYKNPADQEIVALFSALLAYGNVRTILGSVERVLGPLGIEPSQFFFNSAPQNVWQGFKHRFTTEEDIFLLGLWIHGALKSHGTLENFFIDTPSFKTASMKELLSSFIRRFTGQKLPSSLSPVLKKRERNIKYLLSDPERGSACKRLNLFLRWVARPNDGIDLGVWKSLNPERLMLPIDTHLLQTLRKLRWTSSNTANWKVVESATERLRTFCPEDPIRYDFSLCHLSMRGGSLKEYVGLLK